MRRGQDEEEVLQHANRRLFGRFGTGDTLVCRALGLSQQVTVGSPFNTASSGFFEQNGVSWGGHWGGITYNVGNAGLAQPAFGGFNANAGLSTAFAISGRQGQANFFLNFGQGSTQSLVSQTPSVTVMNGQTGYFSDTSQTPFVISYVPVVGGAPIIGSFGPAPSGFVNSMSDPTAGSRVQAMRKMMQPMNQNSGDDGAVGVPAARAGAGGLLPRPRAAAQVARPAAVARPFRRQPGMLSLRGTRPANVWWRPRPVRPAVRRPVWPKPDACTAWSKEPKTAKVPPCWSGAARPKKTASRKSPRFTIKWRSNGHLAT